MNRNKNSFGFCLLAISCFLFFFFVVPREHAQNGRPLVILAECGREQAGYARKQYATRGECEVGSRARWRIAYREAYVLQLKRSREAGAGAATVHRRTYGLVLAELFINFANGKEFGERFGDGSRQRVSVALESHRFKVNIPFMKMAYFKENFSDRAARVSAAAPWHRDASVERKGRNHIANMSDPKIPSVSPRQLRALSGCTTSFLTPCTSSGQTTPSLQRKRVYAVVPADLATIYNVDPLFNKGISGQGQMIVLIEDSDVYSATDWNTFRWTGRSSIRMARSRRSILLPRAQ